MLQATADGKTGEELKREVEDAIQEFDAWFQGLPNEPLSMPEKAIIDTFCYWLVKIRAKKEGDTVPPSEAPTERPPPVV